VFATLVGCSGGKAKAIDDDHPARVESRDGGAGSAPHDGPAVGDVSVRVEWHDVPMALRASPGRTACGTARLGAVAPTTTWGIPGAFVIVVGERATPVPVAEPARVVLEHCALSPRVAVTGPTVSIASAADAPARLVLEQRSIIPIEGKTVRSDPAANKVPIQLPIAGHEVVAALQPGLIYALVGDGIDPAWIVAGVPPFTAITDATGVAVLRDVPVGTHAVVAWLPRIEGEPERIARGELAVTRGGLAELVLDLTKP
jgi:hypothetical protein